MKCNHTACRIPATLSPRDITLVESDGYGPHGQYPYPVIVVYFDDRVIGSLRDDGYKKCATDQRVEVWSVFSGGQSLYVPPNATKDDALNILIGHVFDVAGHWRRALHG